MLGRRDRRAARRRLRHRSTASPNGGSDQPHRRHRAPGEVHDESGSVVTGIVEIATGARHTCARLSVDLQPGTPGPVVCWGDNSDGQLGDGTLETRPLAVSTNGLSDAVALTAGRA